MENRGALRASQGKFGRAEARYLLGDDSGRSPSPLMGRLRRRSGVCFGLESVFDERAGGADEEGAGVRAEEGQDREGGGGFRGTGGFFHR